ncbi:unnamed protein product, partial [Laminaria digitata]
EDVPLRLEPPDLAEAGRWKEAFLTGTGRILAPISALLIATEEDVGILNGSAPKNSKLSVSRLELPCPSGSQHTALLIYKKTHMHETPCCF